jgi:hypothetical protein
MMNGLIAGVGLAFTVSVAQCQAAQGGARDPCPAYVPYVCKSFAERSAIAHGFLADFEQNRKFDAAEVSASNGRTAMADQSIGALKKADTAVQSTVMSTQDDAEARWPMLALWIELFQAIDEGREFERRWYAEHPSYHWCVSGGGPINQNDPADVARGKAFAERSDISCAHSNDAVGLEHEDRNASLTFHWIVFGNKLFGLADRERYERQVNASQLPPERKAMLLACFDHGDDRKWEPPDLYPDVPPPMPK